MERGVQRQEPRSWERWEGASPGAPRGAQSYPHLISDFWPPDCAGIHFCSFKPRSLWPCVKKATGEESKGPSHSAHSVR